jgi:exosortase D (VPLPA-CTERM-specific)
VKSVNDKSLRTLAAAVPLELQSSNSVQPFFWMLFALFAVIYSPVCVALVRMWWNSDDYSHGFLVPIISLYLVWMKRAQLQSTPMTPSYLVGAPLIILAGAMLLAGKLGGVMLLQELSLLVMITGLVLLLAGRAWLKILTFPIAYLLFMIKFFGEGDDRFHWPFQLLAANIGVWMLHLLGFPAYQHAQYIELPRVTLDVAAACSGIRFLMSIMAIGIPLAYFTQRTWSKKIGLIGFAVLIAILANGLRVALIGVWTYYHSAEGDVHGPFHVLQGVLVSWIGFIALFAGAWLLGRHQATKEIPRLSHDNQFSTRAIPLATNRLSGLIRPWVVAATLLIFTGSGYYLGRTIPVPLQRDLSTLPTTIGSWSGEDVVIEQAPFRVTGADQEMARRYHSASGRTVTLYISYFNSQEQDRELVNYQTSNEFYRGESAVTIPEISQQSYQVNQASLPIGKEQYLVFFWYNLNGRVVTGRYQAKLLTLWDVLAHGRSNGALVAISTPMAQQNNLDQLSTETQSFIRDLNPVLRDYLPS